MLDVNRATLLGRAGRDPEIRTLPGGERRAAFGLATSERWKRQDGRIGESTEWHRIVVYGTTVDAVEKLVRKGATVLVEGRIATRAYRDRENVTRHVTEIVVAGRQGLVNVVSGRKEGAAAGDADGGAASGETDSDAKPVADGGGAETGAVEAGTRNETDASSPAEIASSGDGTP